MNRSPRLTQCLSFLGAALVLGAVLAVLFSGSFKSGQVLFSNDGPLGVAHSEALKLPDAFRGFWMDLYWLGGNGAHSPASITYLFLWSLGPVGYAKFYAALACLVLGLSAWIFFRTLGLNGGLATVAALGAALNSNFFSNTCWGLGTRSLALACVFLALAALSARRVGNPWLNAVLAGLATGMGVVEGADNGVIFSLFIAAFVLWQGFVERRPAGVNRPEHKGSPSPAGLLACWPAVVRLALVAAFAGFIATQSLISLVGLAAKTSVTAQTDQQTKEEKWAFATQWSLPPLEMLRVIVPGLYGYRMDTPNGGSYWGRVGEAPGNAEAFRRYSGAGEYAGVLVVLLAAWAVAGSFVRPRAGAGAPERGKGGGAVFGPATQLFSEAERQLIWFWAVAFLVAMVLAWGRFAPFYQFVYALPYFSSIRNPMKFMHAGHLALMVLSGYGLLGLSRRYLAASAGRGGWAGATTFERRWTVGMFAALALSVLAFLLYSAGLNGLVKHLMSVGYPDPTQAREMAKFSVGEVGKFVLFLLMSVAAVFLVMRGTFAGARAKWAVAMLGLVLTLDLARANAPWIVYWDYPRKYATNPVIDVLKARPYEARVVAPAGLADPRALPPEKRINQLFGQLYGIEWVQHHFQFYNIQSVDVAQDPRPPADKQAFLQAVSKDIGRYWELSNTRYVLGMTGFLGVLNDQIDRGRNRFRVHTTFDLALKPGVTTLTRLEDLTAVPAPDGALALFEFTGALPRAKLFPTWQVSTNDETTLKTLADPAFDPHATVLVADPIPAPDVEATNAAAGTVEITAYSPRRIELRAQAAAPSVLLLNDRYDKDWRVSIDGQPASLLRANFLMRGVQVPAGTHAVAFEFRPSLTGLKVSLAAIVLGAVLCGLLVFVRQPGGTAMENSREPIADRR